MIIVYSYEVYEESQYTKMYRYIHSWSWFFQVSHILEEFEDTKGVIRIPILKTTQWPKQNNKIE